MKIASLKIENFRGIKDLEVDFRHEETGQIYDMTLLVGPNGSGKTSIMDAIWFGLQGKIRYPQLRRDFRRGVSFIRRTGSRFAKVAFEVHIAEEEQTSINEWRNQLINEGFLKKAGNPELKMVNGRIEWTYPPQVGYEDTANPNEVGYRYGINGGKGYDWQLLTGRYYTRKLRELGHWVDNLEYAGSVYLIEQNRSPVIEPIFKTPILEEDADEQEQLPKIRSVLVDAGIKAQLRRMDKEHSLYYQVQQSYDAICAPRKMGELYTDGDDEYKIDFYDDHGIAYPFDNLSSGEVQILNILVRYFFQPMSYSIVMLDEPEINLHPLWQKRLIQRLLDINRHNQLIMTTHSSAVREHVLGIGQQVLDLGDLDDVPAWQYFSADEEEIANSEG